MAKNLQKFNEPELEEVFDDKNFVRVPIEKHDENNEPVRGFKTFKIIQRLE